MKFKLPKKSVKRIAAALAAHCFIFAAYQLKMQQISQMIYDGFLGIDFVIKDILEVVS